jgi:hypothetical protein
MTPCKTLRARVARSLAVALALAPLGCDGQSTPPSGITAYLRVSAVGAQFEPGELTTEDRAMDPTVGITSRNTHVFPGAQNRTITGSASSTATAVLLGLQGDSGHWLIPVGGVPDLEVEGNVAMNASISFSPALPVGPQMLIGRAVAANGDVGPAEVLGLTIDNPNATPMGALIVDLAWDTEADLDLHVHVTPDNVGAMNPDGTIVKAFDVWEKQPLGMAAGSASQAEIDAAGALTFDSNARCVIDGARLERLLYVKPNAPLGTYDVRVDTFSLCGEATARWHAKAYRNTTGTPETIIESYGQSIDIDTRGSHNATSGLWVLSFHSP